MNTIPLGKFSVEEFLSEYWQKKPVLIRQAFPNFESPLSPDELAGLTLQEGVLSRLILEQGGEYPWQLKPGPLSDSDFDSLSDHHWTVLVQEVDRHVPAVADLFDRFSFLPSWRKDDVMVSFATRDAGVGAHIDSYDVFLLQGSGKRRWEIGEPVSGSIPADGGLRAAQQSPQAEASDPAESLYIEGLDVRILANFVATETFELEAGDMLYLPPGYPHNGVALEPCLTYSFGFLAPSRAEVASEFAEWHQQKHGAVRYSDPDLLPERLPGLITDTDINRLLRLLQQPPTDRSSLVEWFGCFITRPQRGPLDSEEFEGSLEEFSADFEECQTWRRHEGLRISAWTIDSNLLFANGEQLTHELSKEQLELLSSQRELLYDQVKGQNGFFKILHQFTCRGWGYLSSDEGDDE